jgi:hypothetical protein
VSHTFLKYIERFKGGRFQIHQQNIEEQNKNSLLKKASCSTLHTFNKMSSSEDQMLLKNVTDQLSRLVQEIQDLEECRDEMTEQEYVEAKEDSKEQLR